MLLLLTTPSTLTRSDLVGETEEGDEEGRSSSSKGRRVTRIAQAEVVSHHSGAGRLRVNELIEMHSRDEQSAWTTPAQSAYAHAFDEDGGRDEFEPTSANDDRREVWRICRGIR